MTKITGVRYTEEFKAKVIQLAHSFLERAIRQLVYELGIADQRPCATWSGRQRSIAASEKVSAPKSAKS